MLILTLPIVLGSFNIPSCVTEKRCFWDYEYTIKERTFVTFVNPFVEEVAVCEKNSIYDYKCREVKLPRQTRFNMMYKTCKSWYKWRPYEIVHHVLRQAKEDCLAEVDYYKSLK